MDIKLSEDFFLSAEHAFCLFPLNNQAAADIHGHEFDELVIVCGGCGFHVLNDQVELTAKGDFFFVSANDVHYYEATRNLSLINILIHKQRPFQFIHHIDELLSGININTLPGMRHSHALSDRELAYVMSCAEAVSDKRDDVFDHAYFALTESLVLGIISTLYHRCQHHTVRSNAAEKGIGLVMNFIRQNYHQPIRWRSLGEMAGLSQRTMYRSFKEMTGTTPEKFQQGYRLLKAQELLRTTDFSIKEIARMCGFISSPHLADIYKKRFFHTPSQERELIRSI